MGTFESISEQALIARMRRLDRAIATLDRFGGSPRETMATLARDAMLVERACVCDRLSSPRFDPLRTSPAFWSEFTDALSVGDGYERPPGSHQG